jgi:serine/threonine protein kinase
VKLCDFGLAKKTPPFHDEFHTYTICTLNYRPPELFSTEGTNYHANVDIWSIACVLFEFMIKTKLFPGRKEIVVLMNILKQIPTTENDLKILNLEHVRLDHCNKYQNYKFPRLFNPSLSDRQVVDELSAFEKLLKKMLILDPESRISSAEALQDPYIFDNSNFTKDNSKLVDESETSIFRPLKLKISNDLRSVYVDSIIDMGNHHSLREQTLLLAVNIFDKYINSVDIRKKSGRQELEQNLTIIAICSVILASKYIDLEILNMETFVSQYSESLLQTWERKILQSINFKINDVTLLDIYEKTIEEAPQKLPKSVWNKIIETMKDYSKLKGKKPEKIFLKLYQQ